MGDRQTKLSIDLGDEQILLERVEAVESLGRPFVITVDLFSKLGEIDMLPHLGKGAVVSVSEDGTLLRYFHGIVVEGEFLSEQSEGFRYRMLLRPWSYLLSQNRNYAIFQEKTALDVIREVLKPYRFAHIDYAGAQASLRTREYTVQYGESDFAFITRLLEEEGIYYYFVHEQAQHKLMLCDAPSVHKPGKAASFIFEPNTASVANADSAQRGTGNKFIQRWHERVVSGAEAKVTMRDFDFKNPGRPVESIATLKEDHPLDALEVYQWPGNYVTQDEGKRLSTMLLESRRAARQTYSSDSQYAGLGCGAKFTLTKHPHARFNAEYLITRTHHVLTAETHRTGGGGGGEQIIHFEAIRADVRWHSPITAPRPVVRGPETAIVTGAKADEIFTDEFARIKVRFHWDRSDSAPEKSTCWIRVSQTGGLGNLILPRVGHEVVVDFLDGDPDRPLVMGRVFNKANMPIYKLPDHKTRMLWRSKSYTLGGGVDDVGAAKALDTASPGANEIRFEDKIGKEEVFVHAQRDLATRVRRTETHFVGLDQDIQIHGNRKVTIDETDVLDVKKSIKVDAGTTIEVTAQTSITFICGKSKIEMKPSGITISTVMFKTEAQGMAEVKSPMTTVKGDGMLTLKGGMTMINC